MSRKYTKQMQQKLIKDLQKIDIKDDDSDHGSQQSQDYYQFQRKRMENIVSQLKDKQKNTILQQLIKNTTTQIQYMNQCTTQINDLHNITRNNKQNILQQSIIKQIKQRIYNQNILHSITLKDQQIQQQQQKIVQISSNAHPKLIQIDFSGKELQNKLALKIENAKMEREISSMGREDDLSMKYELEWLSNFFSERFYTPQFKIPQQNPTTITIANYTPKITITNLKPLPNTENNILDKNAPQLALRRLNRVKKIKLVRSSMSEIAVKIKKITFQDQQTEKAHPNKSSPTTKSPQNNQLKFNIQNYITFIKNSIIQIQSISKTYHPKFINYFPNQDQQNYNIDQQISSSKSIQDCFIVDKIQQIKDIKLTFQKINTVKGINQYINVQNVSLQFNVISSLSSIQKCQRIIQLDLSHNKIKDISAISHLKYLKILNIEHNKIESIELRGGSLQILLAANNRIQQIIDLSKNVYLKRLDISNNNLHKITGLTNLYFLQQLTIHNNFLQTLLGIQSCISLRNLTISNNRLTQFHPNFTYIFLNKLLASNNYIQSLPNIFLPSLQQLYLDHNKIEREATKMLYLPSLKTINLDDNCLSGFCVVWSFIRYSRNLQTIKYDKNQYFIDTRQKVKELYQHIIYRNMNNLKILNQNPFDIGIQKYYQGVYNSYLSSQNIFKPINILFSQLNKKIKLILSQNQLISTLQDKRIKFSQTEQFITQKSIMKIQDFIQIIHFISSNQLFNILHSTKSVLYQHDRFQYGVRTALHKVKNMIVKKEYYLSQKKKYYFTNKTKISSLLKSITSFLHKSHLLKAIKAFQTPLQKLAPQKAATIIQKNWRSYKLQKLYKKIKQKLNKNKLSSLDLDQDQFSSNQFNFQHFQLPQFNYQLPEDVDFIIIKPEIIDILSKQQFKLDTNIANNCDKVENKEGKEKENNNIKNQKMVNNFMGESSGPKVNRESQQIKNIMKRLGVKREVAEKIYKSDLRKKKDKEKQAYQNMSASEKLKLIRQKNHY